MSGRQPHADVKKVTRNSAACKITMKSKQTTDEGVDIKTSESDARQTNSKAKFYEPKDEDDVEDEPYEVEEPEDGDEDACGGQDEGYDDDDDDDDDDEDGTPDDTQQSLEELVANIKRSKELDAQVERMRNGC